MLGALGLGKGHKKELRAHSQGRYAHEAKEDARMHDRSKGRVQRMKRARKSRTEEGTTKERKAWTHTSGKWSKSDRYGIQIMAV